MDAWWADLRRIYRDEIGALADAGCRYLQLDEVPLAMLCDRRVRAEIADGGIDPIELVDRYVAFTNEVLEAAPPAMTCGVHMCRGNFRSRWMAEGGYEPVAGEVPQQHHQAARGCFGGQQQVAGEHRTRRDQVAYVGDREPIQVSELGKQTLGHLVFCAVALVLLNRRPAREVLQN